MDATRDALGQRGSMTSLDVEAFASRFDANKANIRVVEEAGEDADGVGTATNTCDHVIGKAGLMSRETRNGVHEPLVLGEELLARLRANDGLEVANHLGEWMGTDDGTDSVEEVGRV